MNVIYWMLQFRFSLYDFVWLNLNIIYKNIPAVQFSLYSWFLMLQSNLNVTDEKITLL